MNANDVDRMLERLRAMAWYGDLAAHDHALLNELGGDHAACLEVHRILHEFDRQDAWSRLNDRQVRTHILRTIEGMIGEAKQHVGLNRNDWFRQLEPDYTAQNEVRNSVKGMRRIREALQRTKPTADEHNIDRSNAWSRLLDQRPLAPFTAAAPAPVPKKPRSRRKSSRLSD